MTTLTSNASPRVPHRPATQPEAGATLSTPASGPAGQPSLGGWANPPRLASVESVEQRGAGAAAAGSYSVLDAIGPLLPGLLLVATVWAVRHTWRTVREIARCDQLPRSWRPPAQ